MSDYIKTIIAPAAEPVSRAEVKTYLHVDSSVEDTLVDNLIKEARVWAENLCGLAIMPQVQELVLDAFPGDPCKIWRHPIHHILSFVYRNSSGTDTTWGASNYFLGVDSLPPRFSRGYSITWPAVVLYPIEGIRIRFICGYAATATFTADASTDTCTAAAHGASNGDAVFVSSSGALPTGLTAGTRYYIINAATNTFKLSTASGGSAVDITDAGTGTHTVYMPRTSEVPEMIRKTIFHRISCRFQNRDLAELVMESRSSLLSIPDMVESALQNQLSAFNLHRF